MRVFYLILGILLLLPAHAQAQANTDDCGLLMDYQRMMRLSLLDTRAVEFTEYLREAASLPESARLRVIENLSRREAHAVIADAYWLGDTLASIPFTPSFYADAHAAWITVSALSASEVDVLVFNAPDRPDAQAWTTAWETITQGELDAAKACPTDVHLLGDRVVSLDWGMP